jgi:hypothetical protein
VHTDALEHRLPEVTEASKLLAGNRAFTAIEMQEGHDRVI